MVMRQPLLQIRISANGSDDDSVEHFLLTIFRMAAFEWFAAVEMSSRDSAVKRWQQLYILKMVII